MRSMLKIAVSLFTTLAVTNLMAQCGPNGCGYQGGYNYPAQGGYQYSQGYQGGYYPSQGHQGGYYNQNFHGGGGYIDHNYNDGGFIDHGYHGGGGYIDHSYQGGGHDDGYQYHGDNNYNYDQGQDFRGQGTFHGGGAAPQGQHYHDGVYGYDQPIQDHPVQDAKGQSIKYYGKPGPDYNAQGGGTQNQLNNASANNPSNTSYNYSASNYNWDNLADAGAATSPNAANTKPNQPAKTPGNSSDAKGGGNTTTSKWQ